MKVETQTLSEMLDRLSNMPATARINVAGFIPADEGRLCIALDVENGEENMTVVFPPLPVERALLLALKIDEFCEANYGKPAEYVPCVLPSGSGKSVPFADDIPELKLTAEKLRRKEKRAIGFMSARKSDETH